MEELMITPNEAVLGDVAILTRAVDILVNY